MSHEKLIQRVPPQLRDAFLAAAQKSPILYNALHLTVENEVEALVIACIYLVEANERLLSLEIERVTLSLTTVSKEEL